METKIRTEEVKTDLKEVTILLLGETGIGKSTWINGFVNFLEFGSLNEAEANPTLCLIPSSFTITDDNYEERLIATGVDKNKNTKIGESVTQHPQSYLFPQKNYNIRLIDTPGIGDARGVEQDKQNFELILDHISHLKVIHSICILLKPNNARLNVMFLYCIKELLTHLHKDACRNIVFCFTNCRSTFYRPGDTLPALRKLLEDNKQVEIPLNRSTLYCMDNEAIRFLYAVKQGINFTPDERVNYIASWDRSVAEIKRLLKHVLEIDPHSIQNTLSLNNARQTVLALGIPMAEVTRNIQMNIAHQEEEKIKLASSNLDKEELSKTLVTRQIEVRYEPHPKPSTVCTAVKCIELIDVGGRKVTNYTTFCHTGCTAGKYFNTINTVGHWALWKCSNFYWNGSCKKCGCSWKQHMQIAHSTIIETKIIPDMAKQADFIEKETAIKKIEKYLANLDKSLNELKEEQAEIIKASIEFAIFLKTNAITPYNDSMDAYIGHFIEEEKNKVAQGGDPKVLQRMEKIRSDYRKQMEGLESAMKDGKMDSKITPEDLKETVDNLYQLKHSGVKLKSLMDTFLGTKKHLEMNESTFTKQTITIRLYKKVESEFENKKRRLSDWFNRQINKDLPKIPKQSDSMMEEINGPHKLKNKVQGADMSLIKKDPLPQLPLTDQNYTCLPSISMEEASRMEEIRIPHQMKNPCLQTNAAVPQSTKQTIQKELTPSVPRDSAKPKILPTIPKKPTKPKQEISTPKNLKYLSKTLSNAPLPPPLPLNDQNHTSLPTISKERASMMEEIRRPHQLKKTQGVDSTNKAKSNTLTDIFKDAMTERAIKVQASSGDDNDDDADDWV